MKTATPELKTIDFGAPDEFGKHHFYVEIPADPTGAVYLYEDYGFDGADCEKTAHRAILARELWAKIKDQARKNFNDRLKAQKMSTGSWKIGKVKLDRFLGRELCILVWAAEKANAEECIIITHKWLALRPEERWWFYFKTVAEAGLADDGERGWRKALYCALADGKNVKVLTKIKAKPKKKKNKDESPSLFDNIEQGNI